MKNSINWNWKNYNIPAHRKLSKIRRIFTLIFGLACLCFVNMAHVSKVDLKSILSIFIGASIIIQLLCTFSADESPIKKIYSRFQALTIFFLLAISSYGQNASPKPKPDTLTVYQGSIYEMNVLKNDTDPNKDSLKVTSFKVNTTSSPLSPGKTGTITGVGSLTIAANGLLRFVPIATYTGTYLNASYVVNDGFHSSGVGAKIVIKVIPQIITTPKYFFSNTNEQIIQVIKDSCKTTGLYYIRLFADKEYYGAIYKTTVDGITGYYLIDNRTKNTSYFRKIDNADYILIQQYGCLR